MPIQNYILYEYVNVFLMKMFFMKIFSGWIFFCGYIFVLGQRGIEYSIRCCSKDKLKDELKLYRNLVEMVKLSFLIWTVII